MEYEIYDAASIFCFCFRLPFIPPNPRDILTFGFNALSNVRTKVNSRAPQLDAADDKRPDLAANFLIPFLATNRIVENYCPSRGSFVSTRESTC